MLTLRIEVWRRAIAELEKLGIDAGVEILGSGIRVRASDGIKTIEHHLSTATLHYDEADCVLEHLTDAAEAIITPRPALVLIEGGKA